MVDSKRGFDSSRSGNSGKAPEALDADKFDQDRRTRSRYTLDKIDAQVFVCPGEFEPEKERASECCNDLPCTSDDRSWQPIPAAATEHTRDRLRPDGIKR